MPETTAAPDQSPPAESPGKVEAPASGAEAPPAAGRAVFQVFRGKDHQFYFRLRAGNGEIILSSEGYRTKHGCQKGIDSVRHNAPLSERYERRATRAGQFSFILKAANHQVIGTSEGYTTPARRQAGIQAVMRVAPLAGVEEVEWKV